MNKVARCLMLAWMFATLWIGPTRVVHAHEGGEVQHAVHAFHTGHCDENSHVPGRHAHFCILGQEFHIPLPPHDDTAGLTTDEISLLPQQENVEVVLIALPIAVAMEYSVADLAQLWNTSPAELDSIHPGITCNGKQSRVLLSSLTL